MSATRLRRLHLQGFRCVDDTTLAEVGLWLRLAPATILIWVALATLLASPVALLALAPLVAAGGITGRSPFDLVYTHGFGRLLGTRPIPRYGPPRRFGFLLATGWLLITALAFQVGPAGLGTALGITMCVSAALPTFTDFCVPSLIYRAIFGETVQC